MRSHKNQLPLLPMPTATATKRTRAQLNDDQKRIQQEARNLVKIHRPDARHVRSVARHHHRQRHPAPGPAAYHGRATIGRIKMSTPRDVEWEIKKLPSVLNFRS